MGGIEAFIEKEGDDTLDRCDAPGQDLGFVFLATTTVDESQVDQEHGVACQEPQDGPGDPPAASLADHFGNELDDEAQAERREAADQAGKRNQYDKVHDVQHKLCRLVDLSIRVFVQFLDQDQDGGDERAHQLESGNGRERASQPEKAGDARHNELHDEPSRAHEHEVEHAQDDGDDDVEDQAQHAQVELFVVLLFGIRGSVIIVVRGSVSIVGHTNPSVSILSTMYG